MVMGGFGLLVAAAYERWFRAPLGTEPQVDLEMPTTGTFVLRNRGARADRVTISDIVVEEEYRVRFPPVFDFYDSAAVDPIIEPIGLMAALDMDRTRKLTIMDFFHRMACGKAIEIQLVRSDGTHSDSATTDALVQQGMTPLRFPLTITVTHGGTTREYKVTLMYDSSQQTSWIKRYAS